MEKYSGLVEGSEHIAYDPSFEMIWLEGEDTTFYAMSDVLEGHDLRDGDEVVLSCVKRNDGRFDCNQEYLEVLQFHIIAVGEEFEDDDEHAFDGMSEDELLSLGDKLLSKGAFKDLPK